MGDDGIPDQQPAGAVIDRYIRRAERIGRLAADEATAHDEAHRIAEATAVLAAKDYGRDLGRARLRRSPLIHAALMAVVLVPVVTALLPEGRGFTIVTLLSLLYVGVHVAEITVGSPVHRFAGRLPEPVRRLLSPHWDVFVHAVLHAFDDRSRQLGRPGCSCVVHDDAP